MTRPTIQVLPDIRELAAAAAELIVAQSERAIADGGSFSIALSGGNTPKALYELLASDAYCDDVDWQHWQVYFGDERWVGPDHPDSNYRMARQALLDHVPLDARNVHRMKGEIDPQEAAVEYGQLLKDQFADGGLDLILLGLGDDGHTASLFPGTAALAETHRRCVANFVPKLSAWRLTLTAPFINRARQVVVLVSGDAKAKKVTEVLEGPSDPQRLPIQLIQPQSGELLWLLDAAAAGMAQ
ncbi:MAG: 6-phosphogluconolactonase [Tepidisphaeraceae bacterium]|jgi:6-phosphogluconolactonase